MTGTTFHPRQVHFGGAVRQMQDVTFNRYLARSGHVLTEVVLLVLIPSLCLGACCLFDPDLSKGILSAPPKVPARLANPVADAVLIDEDRALTVQLHGQMRLWSFSQAAPLGEMQSHITDIRSVAYSKKQKLLAVVSWSGMLEVWNLDDPEHPKLTQNPMLGEIYDCQFTPDGTRLFTSGEFGQLILWDPQTLERLAVWESPGPRDEFRSLAVSSDGKYVLAGTFSGLIHVWDQQTGQHLRSHQICVPPDHADAIIGSIHFLPGDQEFIAASRNCGVGVWNVATGVRVRKFEGAITEFKGGAISPDGERYIAGTMEGQVITWNTATGQQIPPVQHHPGAVKCLLYSTDGRSLLTGDWNGRVLFHRN